MVGKICGTGSYVPDRVVTNEDLAEHLDTSDSWIRERTGIEKRHIAGEETTASMGAKAALRALEDGRTSPEEVELILFATSSAEQVYPGAACQVQEEIGAANAVGFDLNGACSGFVLAFQTAQAYLSAGLYKTALVIGGDHMSRLVDWNDRGTCILFGDGAGAVLLKAEKGSPVVMAAHSEGSKGDALTLFSGQNGAKGQEHDAFIHMDGRAVFQFAVQRIPQIVEEILEKAGLWAEDVDHYVLHQANRRIIEAVAKRIGVELSRFPMNIGEYANTSAATIPLLLDEGKKKGKFLPEQKLLLAGFGAGLTWAACLIDW